MLTLAQMHRLVGRAMQSGATRHSVYLYEWDISGRCQSPVTRQLEARPEWRGEKYVIVGPGLAKSMSIILHCKCRKCAACLKVRQTDWAFRAKAELGHAQRTWFGTLTLRPEVQAFTLSMARKRMTGQGFDFDTLPPAERFAEHQKATGMEVTKFLKRLRKETGARLRYLFVAEVHKSGLPHYHCLLHEVPGSAPIRHAVLEKQWTAGFSKFRLATSPAEAAYLCKYLSKDAAARVRASQGYGKNHLGG